MKFSVVITCYNNLPVLTRSVKAALETTGADTEIILVYNHPPHSGIKDYLESLTSDTRVNLLDPGKNLGCHGGQRYGLLHANGRYLVKLDDDIVVPPGWLEAMAKALDEHPEIAYLSLAWNQAHTCPQPGPGERILNGAGYSIKFTPHVLFGCVMLKAQTWKKDFAFQQPGLYGWEDVIFYPRRATELGKSFGYLISHPAVHLVRSELADPLYGMWKVLYVHKHPSTQNGDYTTWARGFILDDSARQILLAFGYREEELPKPPTPHPLKQRLKQKPQFIMTKARTVFYVQNK